MITCPNKSSIEWSNLVKAYGEDNTWKLWIQNNDYVSVEQGGFQLFAMSNPSKAFDILDKYLTDSDRESINSSTTIQDLLIKHPEIYSDPKYVAPTKEIKIKIQPVVEKSVFEDMIDSFQYHMESLKHARANEIVMKLAEKISKQLGVAYAGISKTDAEELLANTKTPYKNQSAFFYNGTVYFVGDKVSLEDVLHEFGHPLIKSIQISNPELFQIQYSRLEATEEGRQLIDKIKDLYPELEEDTYRFQEEVMVHALERAAMSNIASKGFTDFIKEILYQIKQFLRKAVGKIKVEKLDSSTTLDQLADMLLNDDFQLDMAKITDEDIAMFKKSELDFLHEITDAKSKYVNPGVQLIIDALSKASAEAKQVLRNPKYKDIKGELVGETGGGLIDNIIASVRGTHTRNLSAQALETREKQSLNDKAVSMLTGLGKVDTMITNIQESLQKLDASNQTNDVLTKLQFYDQFLKYWLDITKDSLANLEQMNIDTNSDLYNFVSGIKRNIDTTLNGKEHDPNFISIKSLRSKGAVQATLEILRPIQEKIQESYNKEIEEQERFLAKVTSDRAKQSIKDKITKIKAARDKFDITEDKVVKLFAGELGDSNFWSTMFESYTSNPDPLIGTFAVFLKNNQARIVNNYQRKAETFSDNTRDLMRKLGIIGSNVISKDLKDVWSKYLMTNKVSQYNSKTGEYEDKDVYSLLSSTHNWEPEMRRRKDEIAQAYELTKKETDPDKKKEAYTNLKKLQADFDRFKLEFFNQEYVDQYYIDDAKLALSEHGPQAIDARNEILDRIQAKNLTLPTENDRYEHHHEIKELWSEYYQLSSLYNQDGDIKDEEGQGIAKALNEHKDRMRKYSEWKTIDGAFQRALDNFEATYRALNTEVSEEDIADKINDWVIKNTNIKYTDQYHESVADVYRRLDTFNNSLPEHIKEKTNVSELLLKIRDIKSKYRNDLGDFDGNLIQDNDKDRRELLRLQKEVAQIENNYSKKTGLSVDEFKEYIDLVRLDKRGDLSPDKKQKLADLRETRKQNMLSKDQSATLNSIMLDLAKLQETEFTEAYTDKINYYLARNNRAQLLPDDIYRVLYENIKAGREIPADAIMAGDAQFKDWFMKNHILVTYNDRTTGEKKQRYKPLAVWSQTKPIKEGDIETSSYIRDGKKITIDRVPNVGYQYKEVKDAYRTIPKGLSEEQRERYVGSIIDNRGNYLPKNREQGSPDDSPFVNPAYYYMKTNQPDEFKLLEQLTKHHLSNQVGVERSDKLYLQYPRFTQEAEEKIHSRSYFDNLKRRAGSFISGAKALIKGEGIEAANEASILPEDVDEGNANVNDIRDVKEIGGLGMKMVTSLSHIQGKSDIEMKYVSMDMMRALDTYGLSCEKQRVMREIDPVAQALVETVSDPENKMKKLNEIQTKQYAARTLTKSVIDRNGTNVRKEGMQALYNREMKGEIYAGKHLDVLNKATSAIMGAASFSFFALNIPSALRNYYGALWQLNIEAAGGKHIDANSLLKAKIKAKQDMQDWALCIYGGSPKTLSHQMILAFDPLQDKAESTIGKEYARTLSKDFANMSWLYSPRKFTEMEAAVQLYNAVMIKQKIPMIVNGVETMISYSDAFEIDPETNLIKLKDGIDKEWDINGEKYFQVRNTIHEISNELNGNFSKFGMPQAQGFFAYRLVAFMRRYFTAMFMRRFAVERTNFAKGEVQTGYYVKGIQTIAEIFRTAGQTMPYMTQEEKMAMYKLLTEFAQIAISSLIISAFFGYDPDDKDRFKKLKAKSGAIGSDNFHLDGFISNHALSMFMKVQNENVSLLPLPGLGLNDYMNMTQMGSIAFGPTITAYADIFTDISRHAIPGEDQRLYYKRDVGPYTWQKEGSAKIWNHITRMGGLTGSDIDPVKGIKGIEYSRR